MRKLALILGLVLLLSACSTKPTASVKQVSLILDWYPNAAHTFILAAQEQGYFKEAGFDVTIKMPAENPTDGIKLVGAGKETFAVYYQPDVLLARGEGIPVVSVAAIVRKPLNGLMVPADSGIKTPKDLEGKQVGYPGIPLNIPMVRTMVKTAGGNPDKVTMTDISWDLIPALKTKRVPAIAGGFINHEKPILEKEGTPVTYFSPADWGVPAYYELVLITGEKTSKQDAAAFWGAAARGFEWVKSHKAEALKLLVAKQSKDFPVDVDVETKALETLLPLMEEPGVKFGAQKA
ncbi:MAG TPA: ABC transporter substrate-binding protein, partial [Symbiobacteriaceae bacterium]|nr:ABC transporter substrate-binding protein [Symbiobacteriaceae bacterium]